MKRSLLILGALFTIVSLAFGAYFYWRLKSPGNSFPLRVNKVKRIDGPQYRNELGCPSCPYYWAAVYAPRTYEMNGAPHIAQDESFLHTIRVEKSEEEAQGVILKARESIKERIAQNNQNGGEQSDTFPVFDKADSLENNVLVFTQNGKSNVMWASGNWTCTVLGPAERNDPANGETNKFSAAPALNFAAALPYLPKGATAPQIEYTFSERIEDFWTWLRYWLPVVVSVIFGIVGLILTGLSFWRKKEPAKPLADGL